MKTGRDLIADIDEFRCEDGGGAFWWLGQHSFVVKLDGVVCWIDPFLAPMARRNVPPLVSPDEVTNADIILGTHDHADHIDRASLPTIASASPGARIVVPEMLLDTLPADLGVAPDRFAGLDDMRGESFGPLRVSGVAAAHEFLDRDPDTGRHPYLGYVIEGEDRIVYHSGDSCIYEGLLTKLCQWMIDVAFLPINGRDAERLKRGCIGNMTYQEAADLAGAIEPTMTVPAHYEMFEGNTEDVELFHAYMRVKYPKLPSIRCAHGERVVF